MEETLLVGIGKTRELARLEAEKRLKS